MIRTRTNVVFVMDKSTSMRPIAAETRKMFNDLLTRLQQTSRDDPRLDTRVGLVTFADRVVLERHLQSAADVPPLAEYTCYGDTALFDGIGEGINQLDKAGILLPGDANLLIVGTDGEENCSRKWEFNHVVNLLKTKQAKGNFTFAFQMPPGTGERFASKYGVDPNNVREWEPTKRGVEKIKQETATGLDNYFKARSAGKTRVESFYATTDLSSVSHRDLVSKLVNVTDLVKSYKVDKEERVDTFTTGKTHKPYIIGQTYYQLMKTEKVQPQKILLIRDKSTGEIYGGDKVRDMIGLPTGVMAKVDPGNHAIYDVFVQSTSVNRKLPRGTSVLIDIKMSTGLPPTWDHTAVEPKGK